MASLPARSPRFARQAATTGFVVLLALGGVVAATRLSGSLSTGSAEAIQLSRSQHSLKNGCGSTAGAKTKKSGPSAKWGSYTDKNGATQHHAEGLAPENRSGAACGKPVGAGGASPSTSGGATPAPSTSAAPPLEILGNTCAASKLPAHDGFQAGNRCVSTEFGEVGDFDKNPPC